MLLQAFLVSIPFLFSLSSGKPWHARAGRVLSWSERFHSYRAQNIVNSKDVRVAFLGDSIMHDWTFSGRAIWNSVYSTKGAYNYGISSDCTQQILWRLYNGQFDGLLQQLKLIILMIGTNNIEGVPLNCEKTTGDEVALGVQTIVVEIQRRLPQTKLLLLGILPRHQGQFTNEIVKANSDIMKLANNNTIYYMDITSQFQHSPTQQKTELYQEDTLHLNEAGYRMWEQTMRSLYDTLSN